MVLSSLSAAPAWAAMAAQSKADRVNVRSRPGFAGEIITQLKRGQTITILDTNTVSQPSPGEPSVWFKIGLPADAPLWVSADFVDPTTKTVTGDVLNVRAGPGLDYATVARAPHGTLLELRGPTSNGWLEIAPPQGAYGYVPTNWVTTPTGAELLPSEAAVASGIATTNPPPGSEGTNTLVGAMQGSGAAPTLPPPSGEGTNVTANPQPQTPAGGIAEMPTGLTGKAAEPAAAPSANASSPPAQPGGTNGLAWAMQFVPGNRLRSNPATPPSQPSTLVTSNAPPASELGESKPGAAASVAEQEATPPEVSTPPEAAAQPAAPGAAEPGAEAGTSQDLLQSGGHLRPSAADESEARRVRREGVVIRPSNFLAPSYYALKARDSGRTIDFLVTSRTEPINWREYHNKVVIVTGREYLDGRKIWKDIPILDVEDVEAVR